jgi:hypothetical protein
MADIKRVDILKSIREFLDEYDCSDYLEGDLPANGVKLPDDIKPDLYFVQTDDEGHKNRGIVLLLEEGQQENPDVRKKLRKIVDSWVEDEFELLMISLPDAGGEDYVEQMEGENIFADYWILYEKNDEGELELTILYEDENEEDEEEDMEFEEEIDLEMEDEEEDKEKK